MCESSSGASNPGTNDTALPITTMISAGSSPRRCATAVTTMAPTTTRMSSTRRLSVKPGSPPVTLRDCGEIALSLNLRLAVSFAARSDEGGLLDLVVRLGDEESGHHFTKPCVGHGHDGDIVHSGMLADRLLDLSSTVFVAAS
jgi:hypothetical protein